MKSFKADIFLVNQIIVMGSTLTEYYDWVDEKLEQMYLWANVEDESDDDMNEITFD